MSISKPALERLIRLSRLLGQLDAPETPEAVLSSAQMSRMTGWSGDTIRRDISLLKDNGATAAGYNIRLLRMAIRRELGIGDEIRKCCIVGLGRLGSALLGYEGFRGTVFEMAAGFDSNVNRTEILNAPFPLYPTAHMETVISREKIEYAVLAVPLQAALYTAQRLAGCGIRGIVNFTPRVLPLFEHTEVENVSTVEALYSLAARVSRIT